LKCANVAICFFLSEAKETERLRLTKGIRAALFEKKTARDS
jgi:hypothetical protein